MVKEGRGEITETLEERSFLNKKEEVLQKKARRKKSVPELDFFSFPSWSSARTKRSGERGLRMAKNGKKDFLQKKVWEADLLLLCLSFSKV